MIVLVLTACIFAGVFIAPAIRHDRNMQTLASLDDEELEAVLAEFPDLLDRARWNA